MVFLIKRDVAGFFIQLWIVEHNQISIRERQNILIEGVSLSFFSVRISASY